MTDNEALLERANQDAAREAAKSIRASKGVKRKVDNDSGGSHETTGGDDKRFMLSDDTMPTASQGTKRKAEDDPIEALMRSNLWLDLTPEFNLEKLETRNVIRKRVEEEAPVVITNTADNDSAKSKHVLQELGGKTASLGKTLHLERT